MNSKYLRYISIVFICFLSFCSLAHESVTLPPIMDLAQQNKNAWTISGLIHNEQDDYYGFMFIIERHNQRYHAFAGVFDLNDKKILWQHEETSQEEDIGHIPQHIGRFFWQFSTVNNNLIIGCQDEHNKEQVFNLKIDLMDPVVITPKMSLTPTFKIKQYWSGTINGHIHLPQEQFVTSQSVWIQNIWQTQKDDQHHSFSHMLCKFQDASAMFAIQVPEKNGLHAAIAGLYNNEGQRESISQFINLTPPNASDFSIKLNQNKNELKLHQLFANSHHQAFLAHLKPNDPIGFCIYQNNPWEIFQAPQVLFPTPKEAHSLNFFEKTFAVLKKPYKISYILKNKETS